MTMINGQDLNTMYLPELVDMTTSRRLTGIERDAATQAVVSRLPRSSFGWSDFTIAQQRQIKSICSRAA